MPPLSDATLHYEIRRMLYKKEHRLMFEIQVFNGIIKLCKSSGKIER